VQVLQLDDVVHRPLERYLEERAAVIGTDPAPLRPLEVTGGEAPRRPGHQGPRDQALLIERVARVHDLERLP